MAGEAAKHEKPSGEVVKNTKTDYSAQASEASKPTSMDEAPSDAVSCISSGDATSSMKESDVGQEALMAEQGMYHPVSNYGYYYPGSDSALGEWDYQGYYVGPNGMEFQQPAFQADNGSLLYYMPGYSMYSPFLPGSVIGVDGQYLDQQPYILSPTFQQPLLSPGYYPASVAYGPEMVPAYPWDSSRLYGDGVYGNEFIGDSTFSAPKASFSPHTNYVSPAKPTAPLKSEEAKGSSGVPEGSGVHNQAVKPSTKATTVLCKGYFPSTKFLTYPNQGKDGFPYPASPINVKENGRSWIGNEKLKTQSKSNGAGNGVSKLDVLNEQNCGPRTNNPKTNWISGVNPSGIPVTQGADENSCSTYVVKREDYNLPEFPAKYDDALFFVIKSYSEDDIHKSIKYNVWSSTTNGNRRLDSAFQVARERIEDKGSKCPVFLFFSVNASGQFCGVAEMAGRVDFSKNMDFWQQDKWNGFFPIKWHIIKDVPNSQFRHIVLENNDNKPVTNSRDTQEVKFLQGIEMLTIFKNYSSKTSIFDDFNFYENRQRLMQDRRTKLPSPQLQHLLFQPKMGEATQVKEADDLKPLVSAIQAIDLGATNNSEKPRVGVEVKQ